MKIYQKEILDGLQDKLEKNNTLAWSSAIESYKPDEAFKTLALDKLVAENKDQVDLFYMRSILVSTGWNKNDDVFDPRELWAARNTPEDKPFNFMHNEKDIIGHITGNSAIDFNGNELQVDDEDPPEKFNILTTSVIYTEWSDSDQRERMKKIVAEIEDGKWFVSMECLFPNFDYALLDGDGNTKVVTRDEASAFLTKHLRSYGGTGKYENYRVGRLLRNLSFSGKGLVSKPANPRSVILEDDELTKENDEPIVTTSSFKEKNLMTDNYEKQIEDLRAELAEANTANDALKEKVIAEQQAEFETKIQALEATIAEHVELLAEKNRVLEANAEILEQNAKAIHAKDEELQEKMEELAVMKKKEAVMKRKAQLEEAGLDAEEAAATVQDFADVDDDTFDKVVAVMKKKANHVPKQEDQEEAVIKEKAELDEEQDTAEANEEILDQVDESAEVAIAEAVGDEDSSDVLRATASEWLGSILQSVPKENK